VKRYELVNPKEINGKTMYQIKALIDIPMHNVKAGDLGGYVEAECNLSQIIWHTAWITQNAIVYDLAYIFGNALIDGSTKVYGNARVYENAHITGHSFIFGKAKIHGDVTVEDSDIFGSVNISGNFRIKNKEVLNNTDLKIEENDLPVFEESGRFENLNYDIVSMYGHYEAFVNGKRIVSGDTYNECYNDLMKLLHQS